MLESIELNKEREIVNFKGDLQLSFDEVLELAEDILKERDDKETTSTINGLDLAQKRLKNGGVWGISPYELEQISAEQSQIDGIVELSKFDDTIKHYLLLKVVEEFFTDLENHFADYFGGQGLMFTVTEEKLNKIIKGIEENCELEIEGGNQYNGYEGYAYVPKYEMKKTREWIIKTLRE